MDIVQLRTFLAVVDTGSFSSAGARLGSAQSNVTARVKKLEAEIGGQLFERGKAGASLTPIGTQLLPHAREIVARLAQAENAMKELVGGAAPLRLGALDTTAGSRLPALLEALSEVHPKAEIHLSTAVSSELTRRVWARELDAAFVVGDVDLDRFAVRPAFEERLVEVRRKGGGGAELHLAFGDGCSYRAATRSWLDAKGRSDVPIRDYGSLDTILGCVSAGLGFTVAPESAVERYSRPQDLCITPLALPFAVSTTQLIWRHDAEKGKLLRALLDLFPA